MKIPDDFPMRGYDPNSRKGNVSTLQAVILGNWGIKIPDSCFEVHARYVQGCGGDTYVDQMNRNIVCEKCNSKMPTEIISDYRDQRWLAIQQYINQEWDLPNKYTPSR